MTATGVEVFMLILGPSTRRGGNVMGTTINIGNGEDSGAIRSDYPGVY